VKNGFSTSCAVKTAPPAHATTGTSSDRSGGIRKNSAG
jgi:hypothetical protein